MKKIDYAVLHQQMERLAQTAESDAERLQTEIDSFLEGSELIPPEGADIIFWMLMYDLDYSQIVRCFDWYLLGDIYQRLVVDHENMPSIILEYRKRHPSMESEELSTYLWFGCLYRLAVQNAWQLAAVERLELFRAFVENITIYAMHALCPESWNDEDIYLFMPEVRVAYHIGRAYELLELEDIAGYIYYLDLAVDDCPDLSRCLELIKKIPSKIISTTDGMTQEEIHKLIRERIDDIKQAFQNEDWLKTAELVRKSDLDGFILGGDWEILDIQCRLAERGLI